MLIYRMQGVEYTLPENGKDMDAKEASRVRWLAQNSSKPQLRERATELIKEYDATHKATPVRRCAWSVSLDGAWLSSTDHQ